MKYLRPFLAWGVLGIYWPVLFLATHTPKLPAIKIAGADKTIHLLAYLLLTTLYWLARYGGERPRIRQRKCLLTILIMTVYAGLDELTQNLVPNRTANTMDWIADLGGILSALMILWYLRSPLRALILYGIGLFVLAHWPGQKPFVVLPEYLQQFRLAYVIVAYAILTIMWCSFARKYGPIWQYPMIVVTPLALLCYLGLDAAVKASVEGGLDIKRFLIAVLGIAVGLLSSALLEKHHADYQGGTSSESDG